MAGTALAGHVSVAAIVLPLTVFTAGMGMVFPNAMAGALGPFPRAAGAASALLGFLQMSAAAASSVIAGSLVHTTQLPMALSITAVSATAFLAFVTLSWPRRDRGRSVSPRHDPPSA